MIMVQGTYWGKTKIKPSWALKLDIVTNPNYRLGNSNNKNNKTQQTDSEARAKRKQYQQLLKEINND